jgi:hypothetical protein
MSTSAQLTAGGSRYEYPQFSGRRRARHPVLLDYCSGTRLAPGESRTRLQHLRPASTPRLELSAGYRTSVMPVHEHERRAQSRAARQALSADP